MESRLNEVVNKEVADLNEEEVALLRENIEALDDAQKEKFASVLENNGDEEEAGEAGEDGTE